MMVKDREHPDDGLYFVGLNRYRTDLLVGVFGKMARSAADESARSTTERYLQATKAAMEKDFREEPARP